MTTSARKMGRPTTIPDVRTAIRQAALHLFGERGFDATSIGDVASAAGVAKANVLYHYGTKDDLWREAVDDLYAEIDAFYALRLPQPRHVSHAGFVEGIRVYLEACLRWPAYVQLNNLEGHAPSWRMRWLAERHLRRHLTATRAYFTQLISRGIIPDIDPLILQNIIAGGAQLLLGQYELWRTAVESERSPEDFANDYAKNIVALIAQQA